MPQKAETQKDNIKHFEPKEWDTEIIDYDEKDNDYINAKFENTIGYEKKSKDKAILTTKQYVGILKLPGSKTIIRILPKTTSYYLKLLCYAQKVRCNDKKPFFYYDIRQQVNIEKGKIFFEIIANLFSVELEKIVKKGLYREYVKKNENINFLKGKLLVSKQITKNYNIIPKFYCSYFDLTLDNFINQAILYAALKIIKFLGPESSDIKATIIKHITLLRDEISIKDVILPSDLININFDMIYKKNSYYKEIINLTKIIIGEIFFESVRKEQAKCCNFLIDMNVIFERVIFGLLKNILQKYYPKYIVEDQAHYPIRDLIRIPKRSLQIIPDIIILKKEKKEKKEYEYGVVDVKYKSSIGNQEYYQIIVYSLSLKMREKNLKTAFLINFQEIRTDRQWKDGIIKISKLKPDYEDIDIYQIAIYLGDIEDDYIDKVENQLTKVIQDINCF